MSSRLEQNYRHSNNNEMVATFDAPRPAVTSRLGKKRTDELIRADGDTWQEYLAVCEKRDSTPSTTSKRSGALSFFGRKNKKKENSTDESTDGNGKSSNLTIRSYFQNLRTGKKVWDEPPSGASKIVPALEEMRRMAEIQLDELYVATPNANIQGNDSTNSMNSFKKKKSLSGGLLSRGLRNGSSSSSSKSSGDRNNAEGRTGKSRGGFPTNGRRIRYKPNSNLFAVGDSDRELQEAINRSMTESYGCTTDHADFADTNDNIESEEEILRRVLEESRLESLSSTKTREDDYYGGDENNRKPSARKQPLTNNGVYSSRSRHQIPCSTNQTKGSDRRQQHQHQEASSPSQSPISGGRKGTSRQSKSSSKIIHN